MAEEPLPRCNCANCGRWAEFLATPPDPLPETEALALQEGYRDDRCVHRRLNPHVSREVIERTEAIVAKRERDSAQETARREFERQLFGAIPS
jgi:hypothetical protein